jgi:hypothetical protein
VIMLLLSMDGSLKHLCRAAASFNKNIKRKNYSWLFFGPQTL